MTRAPFTMTQPLNICLFTPTFYPAVGGAENAAHQLAVNLAKRNHHVTILTARQPRASSSGGMGKQVCPCEQPSTLPYTIHHYHRPPKQHLLTPLLSHALAKHHRRYRFDVVLAFYSYPTGYAATRIKRKLNIPVVISPRGEDLYDCFFSLKKNRVEKIRNDGYQHADRIVAISDFIANRVKQVTDHNHPPIDVAYNGIDFDHFDQQIQKSRLSTPNLPIKKPFLLHLARLAPIKAHETAIQAVNLAQSFFRSNNLQYAIVGQGKTLASLKQLTTELNLTDIVHFLGPRFDLEKIWLYDNASLLVTTSREEALGTVNIEAIAAQLPIIASDIPVHREIVQVRNLGRLFETDNPQSLADTFQTMYSENLENYKQNMQKVRTDFTLEKMIDTYEQACYKAIGYFRRVGRA